MRCKELLDLARLGTLTAQPSSKGLNDWTVLHIAADQGAAEVCALLLEPTYGVDVNAKTAIGRTPLHLAVLRTHLSVAEVLLSRGALLNAQDLDGNTPLHLAVKTDSPSVVRWLCAQRPDPRVLNGKGLSPLDVAESFAVLREIEECLLAQQIEYKKPDYGRVTFEGVLRRNSRSDLVEMLLSNSPTEPPPEILSCPPDLIPIGLLGRGLFCEVYLARQLSTKREFAVKVVRKTEIEKHGLEPYLQAERRVLMSVRSPFIVRLHTSFQTADTVVLMMQYVHGGELTHYLQREGALSEDVARVYASEVLLAMEVLHQRHILYRDLKPGNVLIDQDGHAVLIDFGLAKENMTPDKLTWSFCGSPAYLSPEMLRKAGTSQRADWYQFGVLLYEMVAGVPPFFCQTRDLLFANILKAKLTFPKKASPVLRDLLGKLLERDPNKRLSDASAIKRHPFFQSVDWAVAERRGLAVPPPRLQRPRTLSLTREKIYGEPGPQEHILEDWPVL